MKVIGYLRCSTTAQATDGYGLAVQRAEVQSWARHNGHRVVEWFVDEGVSGTTEALDREGLSGALDALERGRAGGIVVPRLDRLARLLTVQEAVLAHVWNQGALAFAADAGEILVDDPEDPMRRAMRQVMGVFSELERSMIAIRMRRGREAKAAAGGYAYGAPRLGVVVRDGELVPHSTEVATIDRIQELHDEGRSLREIVVILTEEGIATKRGGRWHPQTVAKVLARVV